MSNTVSQKGNVKTSVGIPYKCGSILAMIISWSVNHSILWAILHGICSWFYVIYWAIFGNAPWEG